MKILGIETSCDETAAAVVEGRSDKIVVLSNIVSSQIEIHKKYGGVVPEVAAREHVLNMLPVVNEALEKAEISPESFIKGGKKNIDAIAVNVGPGLITSLLVGTETAKTLAYSWNIPIIAMNHIESHIYANWLRPISEVKSQKSKVKSHVKFPAIILTVSGGHTMLVLMKDFGKFKTIGETRDDAAGEAFDKAAQLMGVGYPGGPVIAKVASQWKLQITNYNNQKKSKIQNSNFIIGINLPRPMINDKSYDFSFSGLKTALLYAIKKDLYWKKRIPEYANEFQQAIVDVLVAKTIRAAKEFKVKTVMLSGGVSANKELRKQMEQAVKNKLDKVEFSIPELKYCTDNAAMTAVAGYFRASVSRRKKKFTPWQKIKVDCNLELK